MNLHELIQEIGERFNCHPGPPLAGFTVNNPGRFFGVPEGRYDYVTVRASAHEDGGEHRLCAWLLFHLVALPKREDGKVHTLIWRFPEKIVIGRPHKGVAQLRTRLLIPGADLSKLVVPEGTDDPFLGPVA